MSIGYWKKPNTAYAQTKGPIRQNCPDNRSAGVLRYSFGTLHYVYGVGIKFGGNTGGLFIF